MRRQSYIKAFRIVYCVLFACVVYTVFAIGARDARKVALPVTVVASDTLVSQSNIPRTADVIIRGGRDVIYALDPDRIKVRLDFSRLEGEGIHSVPFELEYDLGILDNARVEIYVQTPQVRISFASRGERH